MQQYRVDRGKEIDARAAVVLEKTELLSAWNYEDGVVEEMKLW